MRNLIVKAFLDDYFAEKKEGMKAIWTNLIKEKEEKKDGSK